MKYPFRFSLLLKGSMLLGFVCAAALLRGQSTAGITGKRDTSYSTWSAYNSTRKTHPDIRIVPEKSLPGVTEKRDVAYCSTTGRDLLLDAFYPAVKKGTLHPAVVIVHGGGWRSGNRAQHHALAQRLAALGYAGFTPEYRLSTEALFPVGIYDVKAAVRWVRAHAAEYGVDTTRIAILGFSAGGEMAAFVGTTNADERYEGAGCNRGHSSAVQAIVDLDGTLSFVHPDSHEGNDSTSISAATYWFGYGKKAAPQLWQEGSPLAHVDQHTPPTLFINSSVPWMHAGREEYRKVLDQAGIYSEVRSFPEAPHSFPLFDPWFEPMVGYIHGFLQKVFGR